MKSKLALLLPIRCISFIVIYLSMMAITNKKLKELVNTWSIVCSIVNILLILLLILITRLNKSSYLELIQYKKGNTKIKEIFIMIGIVLVLGMGGMYLAGIIIYQNIFYMSPEMASPIPIWLAIINFFILPISTALAEDSLYLGCGVNNINNKIFAIIIPGFFFALQHSFIPMLLDIKFILYRFLSFLPLTMLLSYIYYKRKNIIPIMIAHAVIDLCTVILILFMSINPNLYYELLNK